MTTLVGVFLVFFLVMITAIASPMLGNLPNIGLSMPLDNCHVWNACFRRHWIRTWKKSLTYQAASHFRGHLISTQKSEFDFPKDKLSKYQNVATHFWRSAHDGISAEAPCVSPRSRAAAPPQIKGDPATPPLLLRNESQTGLDPAALPWCPAIAVAC